MVMIKVGIRITGLASFYSVNEW